MEKPLDPEQIEAEIERLLGELDDYAEVYNGSNPELREDWYRAEMEAEVARDRQAAKTHLEEFISKLNGLKEKAQ